MNYLGVLIRTILINRLINIAADSGSFATAIDELVLMAENDHLLNSDCIRLMTIHASKGLEFPVVFVVGCEEETFFREGAEQEVIDEEGRIFYVAKTRAERSINYTSCQTRFINGEVKKFTPLRFLSTDSEHFKLVDKRRIA